MTTSKPRYRVLNGEWVPVPAEPLPLPSTALAPAGPPSLPASSSTFPDFWAADVVRRAAHDAAQEAATVAAQEAVKSMTQVMREHLPEADAETLQRAATSGLRSAVAYNNRAQVPRQNVYATNDPWQHRLANDPRYRQFSKISVDSLRLMARNYDILASCITHLKSEVVKTPVKIVPKDDKDDSPATLRAIEEAKAFLGISGGLGGFGSTRAEYESKQLDDLLIVGAGATFLNYHTVGARRDGNPDEMIAIDGSTIRPLVTPFGFAPEADAPAYDQWIMGTVVAHFQRDQMIYRGLPIFARSDSPYYLSPVELVLGPVYNALRVDEWNRTFFTDGNTPDSWMKMPDAMAPDIAREWIELFDDQMAGNSASRRKIKITPGELKSGSSSKDAEFVEFSRSMMERTCSGMGVNPASIGHHSDTYKDSQEIASKSTKEGRVAQLLEWRRTHYDDILARKGWGFLQVVDDIPDAEGKTERTERQVKELNNGIKSVNQIRKENGDETSPEPMADTLFIPNSIVPLQSLNQPKPEPESNPTGLPGDANTEAEAGAEGSEQNPANKTPQNAETTKDPAEDEIAAQSALKRAEGPFSYGCAMVNVVGELADQALEWAKAVLPTEALSFYGDGGGIEDTPHITVRYGFKTDDRAEVSAVLAALQMTSVRATIGPLSLFEKDDFDVLKYTVYSDDLKILNGLLGALPHTDTYAEYSPHLTVAYVKKGAAGHLVGAAGPLTGKRILFDEMVWSNSEKKKCYFEIPTGAWHDEPQSAPRIQTAALQEEAQDDLPLEPQTVALEPNVNVDEIRRALGQWERKATNRLKDRGVAQCRFETDLWNAEMGEAIERGLAQCPNKSTLKLYFARVEEALLSDSPLETLALEYEWARMEQLDTRIQSVFQEFRQSAERMDISQRDNKIRELHRLQFAEKNPDERARVTEETFAQIESQGLDIETLLSSLD